MLLRSGKDLPFILKKSKTNQKEVLKKCVERLPYELSCAITSFHHCSYCYNSNQLHCNLCNTCNINKRNHLYCDLCKFCYPKYMTRTFQNRTYYHTLNLHLHCEKCKTVKEYCMYSMMYKCKCY